MADHDDSVLGSGQAHHPDSPTLLRSRSQSRHDGPSASSKKTDEERSVREESLRQELANVKKVNEAIEGVLESLGKAKTNMKTVDQTVGAASALLNTWTKILSQTEHNQRVILDPSWQGASQDVADIEEETQAKQEAAQRKLLEEQERKAEAARKAEELERRPVEAASRATRSATTRGRGRGAVRGSSTSTSTPAAGAAGSANTSMSSVARGTSSSRRTTGGIGRLRGLRGRT